METRISIAVQMPRISDATAPHVSECKLPVEDQVREALEKIDSGHDSRVEWLMINKIYAALCKLKKPNKRALNIKQMIEPVLAKYGYHKTTAGE